MDKRPIAIRVAATLIATLFVACASEGPRPFVPERQPVEFPEAHYRALAEREPSVFRVDSRASIAVIEVRRAGSFAQLGHDHVVASHDVSGFIAPGQGRADFYAPLDALVVDEQALRDAAGLTSQPSAADVEGTRRNMLEKVLQSERYPFVTIAVRGVAERRGLQTVRADIALHGTTRSVDALVTVEPGRDAIAVNGSLSFDQSSFGIVPYSLLGGAIAVRDRVELTFRLRATRMNSRRQPAP